MKKRNSIIFLISVAIVITLALAFTMSRSDAGKESEPVESSQLKKEQLQSLGAESEIPPVPIYSKGATTAQRKPSNDITSQMADGLEYDKNLSFEENLFRFKKWCESDDHPSSQEFRSRGFLEELYSHIKGSDDVVVQAIQNVSGEPFYRNILLACLLRADVSGKDEIVWGVASNEEENISVRRTAAYLFREVVSAKPRPQEFIDLLANEDDQFKVFVLQSAPFHMDEKGYVLVQQLATTHDDVHVQVAAASAIGRSEFADKGKVLKTIIEASPSSKAEKFSESSTVKRTAIAGMDATDTETYEMIKSIAIDENEDPGVRRRALLKCSEAGTEDAVALLSGLLQSTPEEDAVVIKGCVQGLLRIGGEEAEKFVQNKIETIRDPQIKAMVQHFLKQKQ